MRKTVLVVEDDFVFGMDLEHVLADNGWRVLGPATTAAAALDMLAKERPDAATLDLMLQDGIVTPVAVRLRALRIPFVVVSGRENLAAVGGKAFADVPRLGKPADLSRLIRILDRVHPG
jgi:two-component system, response regulator PdtaR